MSQYWSPKVRALEPYVPGEQPKDKRYIKLNTNECPYPPSPKAVTAMRNELGADLRLYPDPNADALKIAIANNFDLSASEVFVGNGSDEVLAHAFFAFFQQDKPLLYPNISYSFYPVYANLYAIEAKEVPLAADFSINLADYPQENGGIIFPNPNAPTSLAVPLSDIEALLQRNQDSVVIVDEAYVDFGAESAVKLVRRYANLLVVQTFSKSRSLAGARIGMAMGHPDLIEGLERVKNSFNSYPLDRAVIAGGAASIKDKAYFDSLRNSIIATRTWVTEQLQDLGFTVLPSAANFVFVRPKDGEAERLYLNLKEQGVLVRYFNKPRIDQYLRITIGTDDEMKQLIMILQDLLA